MFSMTLCEIMSMHYDLVKVAVNEKLDESLLVKFHHFPIVVLLNK